METLQVLVLSEDTISFKPLKIVTDEYPDLYQIALSSFTNNVIEAVADFYFLGRVLPPMRGSEITNAYVCVAAKEDLTEENDFAKVKSLAELWKSDDAYDALIVTKILNHVYRQEFPTINNDPLQQ